jgi:hypothetical protein
MRLSPGRKRVISDESKKDESKKDEAALPLTTLVRLLTRPN